jgi:hypothetical protein
MKKLIAVLALSVLPLSVSGNIHLTSAIRSGSQSEEIEANQNPSEEIGTMAIAGYSFIIVAGVIQKKADVLSFLDDDGTDRSLAYVRKYYDDQDRDRPDYFQAGVRCKAHVYLSTCTDPAFPAFPDACKGQIIGLFYWNSPMADD